MSPYRRIRGLSNYYKSNEGFKEWVRQNDQWFQKNPDVFSQLMRNPKMVNLFMDYLATNSPLIEKKLGRIARRRNRRGRQT
ncbi:hypothetical protein ACAF76_005570 [Brevibacillus sp. TJ4]|uniref:hypothetical protein n=1 Tax=Brevibacillus sp. TJ4 TaxID=3234853 RepID=UPI003BA27E4B